MVLARKIVVGYLVLVGVAFVLGYAVFGIREHGLWILLMAINLPSSLAVEPQMVHIASSFNWSLGAPPHVWMTQLLSMIVNGLLLFALVTIISKLCRTFKEKGHAV